MMDQKATLTKRLGDLLGFDGAEDILEHLLTIESPEDLLEYLSQLLGQDGPKIHQFVADVGKFQRGERLVVVVLDDGEEEAEQRAPARQPPQENYIEGKKPAAAKRRNRDQNTRGAAKKKPGASQKPENKPKPDGKRPKQSVMASKPASSKKSNPEVPSKSEPALGAAKAPPKKSHPPKGKAPYVCGCYGRKHKALTNCLYCGRISCEKEGYNFCPFCGYLVEKVDATPPADGSVMDKAWLHKERLLRFDREFAKRTVILDDHEDYYRNQTSSWLAEDERAEAAEREQERQRDLHTRKKQTLDIVF